MIVLDTHVLWWLDQGSNKLGTRSLGLIENAQLAQNIGVSAITFWEIALLIKKQRLKLEISVNEWRLGLLNAGLVEHPLQGDLLIASTQLALPHQDPADRMIVATAQKLATTLITADEKLLAYNPDFVDARA